MNTLVIEEGSSDVRHSGCHSMAGKLESCSARSCCLRKRRILLSNEDVALIPYVGFGLVGEALCIPLVVKWPNRRDSQIPCRS